MRHLAPALLLAGLALPAAAQPLPGAGGGALSLDSLLQRYRAEAPPVPRGEVRLDAWVEAAGQGHELVILLEPLGETKLNAEPGIIVTPQAGAGVTWQVPVPHQKTDPSIPYFEAPATLRLPFTGGGSGPIEVVVEYAYCVVDYQCFFGEETLSVARDGF